MRSDDDRVSPIPSVVASHIEFYGRSAEYRRFLEIGTGMKYGTTKWILEGFKRRREEDPSGVVDYHLDSLERNRDNWMAAKTMHADVPEIRVHHARLVPEYPSFDTIMNELGEFGGDRTWTTRLREEMDVLQSRLSYVKHLLADRNFTRCAYPADTDRRRTASPQLERWKRRYEKDDPDVRSTTVFEPSFQPTKEEPFLYDVVFMDATCVFSYYDFQRIRHVTRMIWLHDCRALENQRLFQELQCSEDWMGFDNLDRVPATEQPHGWAFFLNEKARYLRSNTS